MIYKVVFIMKFTFPFNVDVVFAHTRIVLLLVRRSGIKKLSESGRHDIGRYSEFETL